MRVCKVFGDMMCLRRLQAAGVWAWTRGNHRGGQWVRVIGIRKFVNSQGAFAEKRSQRQAVGRAGI